MKARKVLVQKALVQKVLVQEAAFDIHAEHLALKSAGRQIGAIATFVGSVRDTNEDAAVTALHLEHYPGMTEKEIHKILDEAATRWELIAATVIHRVGRLAPGDDIVYVGMASGHRGDAFSACEFVMDYLKTRATFWKKESTSAGERWLTTRQSDIEAADAWPG